MRPEAPIESVAARAYTIPTDAPEADGTFAWTETTLVTVHVQAGGKTGFGYTYGHACQTALIETMLAKAVQRCDAMDVEGAWSAMQHQVRNIGRGGQAAMSIAAVDIALWDLKARLLDLPLVTLLGAARQEVPIYGSGGFTTYSDEQLRQQLQGWVQRDGCRFVKMKVGTDPDDDPRRVAVARHAIDGASLFVDANGAYSARQAISLAGAFVAEADIAWFEEPVSSDDLAGLHFVRQHVPEMVEVAAGEYGYDLDYVRRMLDAQAVDVQQADITRCAGITGFLRVAALCDAHHTGLSAHCAPSAHLHAACAVPGLRHLEWFHDHVRIEHLLFDGAP
ncbi:MAG: mandelate racemase, partial [Proteobacteria bacterium]|nr:mandelate racemase [Pseudomonadota bacterium]